MEIDQYCQRQYCSPLNVLFIDVQISLILLGFLRQGATITLHGITRVCQQQLGFLVFLKILFPFENYATNCTARVNANLSLYLQVTEVQLSEQVTKFLNGTSVCRTSISFQWVETISVHPCQWISVAALCSRHGTVCACDKQQMLNNRSALLSVTVWLVTAMTCNQEAAGMHVQIPANPPSHPQIHAFTHQHTSVLVVVRCRQ